MNFIIVTVDLTAEDIREGVKQNCLLCPHARAISRRLGQAVAVSNFTFNLADQPRVAAHLPPKVSRWIFAWDRGYPSEMPMREPFSYEVEVPEHFLKGAS